MSASLKLSTSVKALCYLAKDNGSPKTSLDISKNIDVNASKIRMILSMLSKSGIVKSETGVLGGFALNKPPHEINLQEVYCAIEDRKAFYLNVSQVKENEKNDTARINNYFLDLFSEIQVDIENKMRTITIKSIMDKINN